MHGTNLRLHPVAVVLMGVFLFNSIASAAGERSPAAPPAQVRGSDLQVSPVPEEPLGELTLDRAKALALALNPVLSSLARGFDAGRFAVNQAGVLPNPALSIAGENLGNDRLKLAGDRATVLQIEQLIELGGKRAARVNLAQTGRDLAAWDYQAQRVDLILQVSVGFTEVLAGQQRQLLAEDSLALARAFADLVSKRVAAGKASPVEETRARLSLSSAEIELEQARRELAVARQRLSSLWNNPAPRFEMAVGNLERVVTLPGREQLISRARGNPDIARWDAEVAQQEAAVDVAKAKGRPDLTVTGGVARFSQFNDNAYTIGISIPIPLFDRNRGGILEATSLRYRAIDQKRAAEIRVTAEIANAEQRLAASRVQIETLRTRILPSAQSAFEATATGYQLGKFGFIDVIDAQRTLFQVRSQYLEALANYQRSVSEIERLVGDEFATETPALGEKQAGERQ